MRIPCPFCGTRGSSEFAYLGDAASQRSIRDAGDLERSIENVYLRDNPAGAHDELWYHAFGCRRWLSVTRDTRTHEIFAARYASPAETASARETPDSDQPA